MKKVALACTGGGIKASTNIGVIRALKELNIEIEAISGSSLGALIALLYLCGYTPDEMIKIYEGYVAGLEYFNLPEIICAIPNLLFNGGLKNPKILIHYVQDIENKNNVKVFTDIKKPFIVPSLDISNREILYYSSVPLEGNYKYYCNKAFSEAIRSTSAIPLFYTPNKIKLDNENHYMLDGGILTNTLVSPLKQFSDYVIGVTHTFYPKKRKNLNAFTGFTQTFQSMRRSFLEKEKEVADLWIEVDTGTNKFLGAKKEIRYYEHLRL